MEEKDVLGHLEQRLTIIQAKTKDLLQQREEIDRQIKNYKELLRYYRGVYEAESGVGVQGQISPETVKSLEQSIAEELESIVEPTRKRNNTITWAVSEILAENSPLRVEQLVHFIMKRYPDIAEKAKDLFHSVEVACIRGTREEIYERVARRCYGIKRKEDNGLKEK